MVIGIPSYKRPECKTIKTLLEAGVQKSDIIVSTQTEEDFIEFKRRYDISVIFRDAHNAAGNRNTIIDYVGTPVVLMDDDVLGFSRFDGKNFVRDSEFVVNKILNRFDTSSSGLIGIYASENGLYRQGVSDTSYSVLLQGTVLCLKDRNLRFNEKWSMIEDYELCLRAIRAGVIVERINDYAASKPSNGTNKGGMHERYESGELKQWLTLLNQKYPEFVPNKKMTGGRFDAKRFEDGLRKSSLDW